MSDIYDDVKDWIKKISTRKKGYQICPFARKAKYKIYTHLDRATIIEYAVNWKAEYDLILCKPKDTSMSGVLPISFISELLITCLPRPQ